MSPKSAVSLPGDLEFPEVHAPANGERCVPVLTRGAIGLGRPRSTICSTLEVLHEVESELAALWRDESAWRCADRACAGQLLRPFASISGEMRPASIMHIGQVGTIDNAVPIDICPDGVGTALYFLADNLQVRL